MDLAYADATANAVFVLQNTSAGPGLISYDGPFTFPMGTSARSLVISDLDGDGKPDIASANGPGFSNFKQYQHRRCDIILQAHVDYGSLPHHSVTAGDFDGDGKPDLALVNQTLNSISILRYTGQLPSPTITGFSPLSGPVGTPVTITGTNFDTTPAKQHRLLRRYKSSSVQPLLQLSW